MTKEKKKKKRKIDLLFITACISTSLVLLLIGIITFLLLTANDLSTQLKEEMNVEIVLKDNITDQEKTALERSLTIAPYCKEHHFISKDDALVEMTAAMGVDPSEFLEYNPFYASYNITLNADYAATDSLQWIEKALLSKSGVTEVNYQREILDIVNDNIQKVTIVLLALAAILSLISFTLINNTIKLTIYSQRFLLYSMKLVGAKWSFIRRPFIRHNLLIGLTSAIIASGAIYGGLKFAVKYEPGLAVMLKTDILTIVFAVITLMGILLTTLCALRSVNRFLRMKSGELHYI